MRVRVRLIRLRNGGRVRRRAPAVDLYLTRSTPQNNCHASSTARSAHCAACPIMTQSSLPPECHLTFTPIESSLGGLLIGLSAAVLLLCYGRVLGFSGILAQSTIPFASAKLPAMWRLLLVLGLVVGGIICTAIPASGFPYATIDVNEGIYVLGGVAVGLGASVGNGCTSGHGICGLGRLSPRSFVAVMTFMASAFVTAIVTISEPTTSPFRGATGPPRGGRS